MKPSPHALPQDRKACACTALRRLARHATAIYDSFLEPIGLKQTQYAVLARLDRLVHCNLSELAAACDLDVTSLSRGLRPLIAGGYVQAGRGNDDRTKRYELTTQGKRVLRRAYPRWNMAQNRLLARITPGQLQSLQDLSSALRSL